MIAFILENSADPDAMTHSAAFHLAKVPNRCSFWVSSIQVVKHLLFCKTLMLSKYQKYKPF